MALTKIDNRGLKTPIDLSDNEKIRFGTGNDLQIYASGNNSVITHSGDGDLHVEVTGSGEDLYLNANDDVYIRTTSNENAIKCIGDGAVELYYDNSKKFETTSGGATVTGDLSFTGDLYGGDGDKILLGGSSDLEIYFDNTHSRIVHTPATGDLVIQSDDIYLTNGAGSEYYFRGTKDGAVELYYDNSKKLETTSAGAAVTGTLTTDKFEIHDDGSTDPLCLIKADDENPWGLQVRNDTYDAGSCGFKVYQKNSGQVTNQIRGNSQYVDHIIQQANGSATRTAIKTAAAGQVELYHDNELKLSTSATGVDIQDTSATSVWTKLSNSSGIAGYVYGNGATEIGFLDGQQHWTVKSTKDGSVDLYHNNSKKFETTENGVEVTGQLVSSNISGHNIIVNGAMQIAQRGTSISAEGYACDRFHLLHTGIDEEPTLSQHSLSSSDTGPWEAGFRNSLHLQNGNQTGGAGAGDYMILRYKVEAQDLANSGWNYESATSYITLSYWVKSSVAQNFYGYMRSHDGTAQLYAWETGSLTADTWTKITKTIPGQAAGNIDINNDNGIGMMITFSTWWGGDWTNNNTLNTWAAYDSANRTPDQTSTWYTTNDATFEITGVQLEVGKGATEFDHRSYGDELLKCQRYYQQISGNSDTTIFGYGRSSGTTSAIVGIPLTTPLRASPSLTCAKVAVWSGSTSDSSTDAPSVTRWTAPGTVLSIQWDSGISGLTNARSLVATSSNSSTLEMDSEL